MCESSSEPSTKIRPALPHYRGSITGAGSINSAIVYEGVGEEADQRLEERLRHEVDDGDGSPSLTRRRSPTGRRAVVAQWALEAAQMLMLPSVA